MGNEIVKYNDLEQLMALGSVFVRSGLFSDAQDEAKAVVKILAGAELGFSAFASMEGIHIIRGNVALSANLMASAVKRSGRYKYRVLTMEHDVCEIEFFEREGGAWESIGISRFDVQDANRAGTQNMNKFPRNMLFARAMSNGVRWYCPDVTGGPAYTPEELGELVDESGDLIQIDAPPAAFLPAPERVPTHCADCSQPIADYFKLSATEVANRNIQNYGRALCSSCGQKAKKMDEWLELFEAAVSLNIIADGDTHEWPGEDASLDTLKRWERDMMERVNQRLGALAAQSGIRDAIDSSLSERVKAGLEMREVITRAEMTDEPAF